MNSGQSRRSLRRGRSVEIISHATLVEAAKRDIVSVKRLAYSLGLEVDGLDPYKAANKIMRWFKRNPQPRIGKR